MLNNIEKCGESLVVLFRESKQYAEINTRLAQMAEAYFTVPLDVALTTIKQDVDNLVESSRQECLSFLSEAGALIHANIAADVHPVGANIFHSDDIRGAFTLLFRLVDAPCIFSKAMDFHFALQVQPPTSSLVNENTQQDVAAQAAEPAAAQAQESGQEDGHDSAVHAPELHDTI